MPSEFFTKRDQNLRFLVTGGAGFIGSAFVRHGLTESTFCKKIVTLDLLTYAGNLRYLSNVLDDPRHVFVQGTICDQHLVATLCEQHQIDVIVHFAAESHVDRSITGPLPFFETNVRGTFSLLEVVRKMPHIHFHQVSTDEVYGSLEEEGFFSESSAYQPNSPYSASKAAADHFVRAYAHTYGLKTTLSHCSNNYGPCQCTEKLIPRLIVGCMEKSSLPVYGQGLNVRDWLYVQDHVEALWTILEKGKIGEIYDIGGNCEKKNIDVVHAVIDAFASLQGEDPAIYRSLIHFVADRPGHDFRYAIDCRKIQRELHWTPKHSFAEGIKKTVSWYLKNIYENRLCDPSPSAVHPISS